MLEKLKNNINNNRKTTGWILLGLIVMGIFLRTYQYHDWLFFKWDQARDALVASEAIENGLGFLPLLGPRATKVGDDYLRLGPAFYYAQYFSGFVFNSTAPEVFAYPDTLFAILTIPLLFLFLRLYFNRVNSLLGTTLYTFSFLIIQYSRFAWNPNAVPFFMLLTFYGMLMMLKTKKYKQKLLWLLVWMLAMAIATQYHFFALFGLIAITAVYFFFYLEGWKLGQLLDKVKSIFNKKTLGYVLIPFFVFVLIYSPVIISDMKTDWSNARNFIGAFIEKPKDKPFGDKVIRNFREQGKNYNLIATSFWTREGKKADPWPVAFGLFLMASGIFLPLWKRSKTKDEQKRNFLLLMPVWVVTFFFVTISISYQLRPRYFTAVFPVPFIAIVFWMSFLQKKYLKKGLIFSCLVFLAFLLMNIYGTAAWFKDNTIAQKRNFPTDRNFILKKDDGITLGQLEKTIDYILKNIKEEKEIVFYSKAEYSLPIEYLLLQREKNLKVCFVSEPKELIGHHSIFAINTVKGGLDSVSDKIKKYTNAPSKSEEFGEIIVFEMSINNESLETISKDLEIKKEQAEQEDSIEGDEEVSQKTERLFWKDVF